MDRVAQHVSGMSAGCPRSPACWAIRRPSAEHVRARQPRAVAEEGQEAVDSAWRGVGGGLGTPDISTLAVNRARRPDRRRRRVGEDNTREGFVVRFTRLAQDVRGDDVGLVLAGCRHGQMPVTSRSPRAGRRRSGARRRGSRDGRPRCRRSQPDAVDRGRRSARDEQAVTAQLGEVVEGQDVVVAVTPRLRRVHDEHQVDAVATQDFAERIAERCGLAGSTSAPSASATSPPSRRTAWAISTPTVAAEDQQAAGVVHDRSHFAVRRHALEPHKAWNRRHDRFCAGGDDDVPGGVPLPSTSTTPVPASRPGPRSRSMPWSVSHSRHRCPCGWRP